MLQMGFYCSAQLWLKQQREFCRTHRQLRYRKQGKTSNNSGAEKEPFGKKKGSLHSSHRTTKR